LDVLSAGGASWRGFIEILVGSRYHPTWNIVASALTVCCGVTLLFAGPVTVLAGDGGKTTTALTTARVNPAIFPLELPIASFRNFEC
jgi:small neutral amino acid transporter SnatA (MarC family)